MCAVCGYQLPNDPCPVSGGGGVRPAKPNIVLDEKESDAVGPAQADSAEPAPPPRNKDR